MQGMVSRRCATMERTKRFRCRRFVTAGEEDCGEQARELFDALRELDEQLHAKTVYARCPEPEGVGLAVYNRLIRAAGFEVIDVG